jgi:hypothetical protein
VITAAQFTVGQVPVVIANTAKKSHLILRQTTGSASVYLGPLGVTTATGFQVASSTDKVEFDVGPGEQLFAVADGPAKLYVLLVEL